MIRTLFLWFYCLPIPQAVLVIVLATGCFLMLNRRYETNRLWRKGLWGCCLLWLCIVLAMTLKDRSVSIIPAAPLLTPFHSYGEVLRGGTPEILRSNFMNVMLFYPGGLLLNTALPRRWKPWQRGLLIAVLCAAASTCIEVCQYFHCLGTAETDDVIHNTLGAVLGAVACKIPLPFQKK